MEINKNVFVEDLNKDNYPMKIWSNVALVFFRGMKKTSQTWMQNKNILRYKEGLNCSMELNKSKDW